MGKSEDQLKKRTKDVAKSPISPVWLSKKEALLIFETQRIDSADHSCPGIHRLRRPLRRGPLPLLPRSMKPSSQYLFIHRPTPGLRARNATMNSNGTIVFSASMTSELYKSEVFPILSQSQASYHAQGRS